MKNRMNQMRLWLGIVALALATAMGAGCDDNEFDRDPPAGQGSLIVDNFTGDRILVYLDGTEESGVSAGKHRYYDLEPGVCRVVLDGDDTRRSWSGDVDVLEGRRTVVEVRSDSGDYREFEVSIYLD